ncbi:MAG: hypothetical protein EAZ36_01465 [Verrucomicrobia bacterium]|nr:MAG: hypothetical protein EAZ36_01465 [Verrucomicrobiota bacterium]
MAAIGAFAIFVVILIVAYLPNKVVAVGNGEGVRSPAERKAALAELQGTAKTKASTYGWVDKDAGVVRLPIDRAIEIYLQEKKAK